MHASPGLRNKKTCSDLKKFCVAAFFCKTLNVLFYFKSREHTNNSRPFNAIFYIVRDCNYLYFDLVELIKCGNNIILNDLNIINFNQLFNLHTYFILLNHLAHKAIAIFNVKSTAKIVVNADPIHCLIHLSEPTLQFMCNDFTY